METAAYLQQPLASKKNHQSDTVEIAWARRGFYRVGHRLLDKFRERRKNYMHVCVCTCVCMNFLLERAFTSWIVRRTIYAASPFLVGRPRRDLVPRGRASTCRADRNAIDPFARIRRIDAVTASLPWFQAVARMPVDPLDGRIGNFEPARAQFFRFVGRLMIGERVDDRARAFSRSQKSVFRMDNYGGLCEWVFLFRNFFFFFRKILFFLV